MKPEENVKKISLNPFQWKKKLKSFKQKIGENSRIEELELDGFASFPEDLCKLTSLKKIKITMSKLSSLPESFCDLVNLETLNLWNNRLQNLPESFGKLTKLKVLQLSNNDIKSLPESFGQLFNLELFDMEENHYFTEFPKSFPNLKKLKIFKISYSGRPYIPESFANLTSLEEFTLDQYQLYEFPANLGIKLIKQGCRIYAYISSRDEGGDSEWVLEELSESGIKFWCIGSKEKHLKKRI